ncbi:PhzF family phenazine biosynthesis protein [Halovenus rubra]|uniref:PhzF family phenazine biosynthesis protein n=2 Tax=Halovenus rubra TaxID=869890 RepID=A0ABD5X4L5_9EURY|nr:PhzF family phenazine biosynthesis protein [Halovenus rubra]
MEKKQLLLVDAFADEPLAGVPVPVVLDDTTQSQLRSIADEFGADGAVSLSDDGVRYVEHEGTHGFVAGAVAGWTALAEHNKRDDETAITVISSDGKETEYPVGYDGSRDVRVEIPDQRIEPVSVSLDRVAPALDVTVEALSNVTEELPVARAKRFGGTLFVPVGFIDDLGACSPDRETLAAVLSETGSTRVCAFTFDTLGRRSDVQVRLFDPATHACERATSGVAVAGCGQYLGKHNAFDGDIETLRVECGYFRDRPGTIETTLDTSSHVGGRGLTVSETTVSVPEPNDGSDIIEL